jgi:pimeloyl-ACP methyl ester carboxylesterase
MAKYSTLNLTMDYGRQTISCFDRPGPATPVVFVHGLGNAAANFEAMLEAKALARHRLIALDLPGSGGSPYPRHAPLDIDGLVRVVHAFVEAINPPKFLLVGASMGGLVGLLYAEHDPERLTGFLNVEGNLAPEDCMYSRLAVGHTYEAFAQTILPGIKASLGAKNGRGFARHLEVLERADSLAYYNYSLGLVEHSDHGRLIERFLALPVPIHFVYGSANHWLSYLPRLRASRCTLTEVADADHFLFYDDPTVFAECVQRSVGGVT